MENKLAWLTLVSTAQLPAEQSVLLCDQLQLGITAFQGNPTSSVGCLGLGATLYRKPPKPRPVLKCLHFFL